MGQSRKLPVGCSSVKSDPLPLAPLAFHLISPLPGQASYIRPPLQILNPGFPVRVRAQDFPLPLALGIFDLGLKSYNIVFWERNRNENLALCPLFSLTEVGQAKSVQVISNLVGNVSAYSLLPSLGRGRPISMPCG